MHEHENTLTKITNSFGQLERMCVGRNVKLSPQLVEDQGFRSSLVERTSREIGPLYKLFGMVLDEKRCHARV